jgi:glycosyltransferase involved in cell wall biosynthesis
MKTIVQLCIDTVPISIQGGREKVFVELSNLAVEKNYEVINICNGNNQNEKPFFPLNKKAEFHNLGLGKIKIPFYKKIIREIARALHLNVKNYLDDCRVKVLAKYIYQILKDREIYAILCYSFKDVEVANQLNLKSPKIAMVHGHIQELIHPLTKNQLKQADKMSAYQVLMPSFVEEAKKYLNIKVVWIPNIVPQIKNKNLSKQSKSIKTIIHIGRIHKFSKQQHLLVEAFAKIAHKFSDWEVHLYGVVVDKWYKDNINDFIKNNNLQSRVFFKGIAKEPPFEELLNADIFGFPSAHEGFGLALTEAMSAGLPSIGFKDTPAVNELIKDGKNGFLCKDVDDFADKLATLMASENLRATMGLNARESMKEYSPDKVWAKWEKLFSELNT